MTAVRLQAGSRTGVVLALLLTLLVVCDSTCAVRAMLFSSHASAPVTPSFGEDDEVRGTDAEDVWDGAAERPASHRSLMPPLPAIGGSPAGPPRPGLARPVPLPPPGSRGFPLRC